MDKLKKAASREASWKILLPSWKQILQHVSYLPVCIQGLQAYTAKEIYFIRGVLTFFYSNLQGLGKSALIKAISDGEKKREKEGKILTLP